jgi:DNA-directed RNA polymerase subunit RPC12/RpoP
MVRIDVFEDAKPREMARNAKKVMSFVSHVSSVDDFLRAFDTGFTTDSQVLVVLPSGNQARLVVLCNIESCRHVVCRYCTKSRIIIKGRGSAEPVPTSGCN